jgi:hypothetical protein
MVDFLVRILTPHHEYILPLQTRTSAAVTLTCRRVAAGGKSYHARARVIFSASTAEILASAGVFPP